MAGANLSRWAEWRALQFAKNNVSFYFWQTPLEAVDFPGLLEQVREMATRRAALLARLNQGGAHAEHNGSEASGSGVGGDAAASDGVAGEIPETPRDDAA